MQYRTDPRSGQQLSQLGFGMMRLPRGIAGIDQEKTTAMVRQAVEAGVNYLDTAYVYPGSEAACGKALAQTGLRDKVYIATKIPHRQVRSPADFDRIFNEQLARLQTDHIDYYLIHNLPSRRYWQRIADHGAEEWLAKKQAEGQIGQVGFSFHGKQADFVELLDAYDWDFTQIQYNYLDDNFQAGQTGLRIAAARGLMVVIMEPLRGGLLVDGLPPKAQSLFAEVDPEASAAAWGLRWVFDQSEPTVVLSGMSTSEQMAENLATAAQAHPGMLSEAQRDAIEKVVAIFRLSYKVPCTSCSYCMPCPEGVNIPDCFAAYNTRLSQGLIAGMTQYFTGIASPDPERYSGPAKCVACGTCERKCPQDIAIIESLAEMRKRMEPFWFKPVLAVVGMVMGDRGE